MRSAVLVPALAVLLLAQASFGRGIVAEGGGFALTPEDLRLEVRKLGPSYHFDGTYDDRKTLVDLLAARFFLAESALARGYGEAGVAEVARTAESDAVGQSYRTWRIEKAVRVPRAESKQVLEKLDRKLHVIEMVFSDHGDAGRVLARLKRGDSFDSVAASLAGAPGVLVEDPGWRVWREIERSVAIRVFDLLPGQTTGIIRSARGHVICHLVEAAPWDEGGQELIAVRSRRFIRWQREADLSEAVGRELSSRYGVRYNPDGVQAAVEAFRTALAGQMTPESLLSPWVVRYDGPEGEVAVSGAELFAFYWSMQPQSAPYVGDAHSLEQFALDVILPDLESAAGYDLGLVRLREVAWNVKKAREESLIPRMEESLTGGVRLAPGEAEAFFQKHRAEFVAKMQYRMRRILLKSAEDARDVLADIRAGRDFAGVAIERSTDQVTAGKGGDLGTISSGMFKLYDSLAVALEVGEISDPLPTGDGVEILKLEERTQPRALSFEEARAYVEQAALEAKTNGILSDWVKACKAACGFRVDYDLLAAVDLPQPDWMSSVAREGVAEEGPAAAIGSDAGAGTDGQAGKAAPESQAKQRPGKRRMIKKQG